MVRFYISTTFTSETAVPLGKYGLDEGDGYSDTTSTHSRISRLFSYKIAFNTRTTSHMIRAPFDQGELTAANLCSTRSTPSSVFITRFLKCIAVSPSSVPYLQDSVEVEKMSHESLGFLIGSFRASQ